MEEASFMKYPYLFEKGKIGNVEIKNRIVMAPMGITGLIEYKGIFSDRAIDYYERRAIGGTGLIITGVCLVNSKIEPWEITGDTPLVTFDAWWKVRNFIQLTERVHDYGAKIFAQLTAGFGRVFINRLADKAVEAGVQPVAPSPTPLFWRPKIMAREMTTGEIDELVESFGKAALIAKASQFDGVELHGHEGYLMDQFKTVLWNRRTDKYGGDLTGRMNFVLSIIKVIQEKVGSDFPIIYRYGLEHKIEGGRTAEEGIEIAKILEKSGVAALHVDAGCYDNWYWPHPPVYQPPGCMVDMAEKVRPHVKIPVITVGRLGYPDLANQIIQDGKADFIALGRPLLADPDFVAKARRGQADEIRPCIGCHECFARLERQQSLSCTVNPQCGDEKRLDIVPTSKPKKVMVIGGGIAGMEAARVCALRGHRVTLYERTNRLGGILNVASQPDFKQDIRRLLNFQIKQLNKLNDLEIKMNTELTEEMIQAEKPDVIFIATGSVPLKETEIEGLGSTPFVTPEDVFEGKIQTGSKAFIIGGGSVGCETALYLAKKKWSVVVAEMLPMVASDLFEANREMLLELLKENGVEILTQRKVKRVTPGKIFVSAPDREQEFTTDLLVLSVGRQPVNNLAKSAEGMVQEVYVIGDCLSARKIKDAIWEAFKKARII
jgi:2-enoate reductase